MLVDHHLLPLCLGQHHEAVVADDEGVVDLVAVRHVNGDKCAVAAGGIQKRILQIQGFSHFMPPILSAPV